MVIVTVDVSSYPESWNGYPASHDDNGMCECPDHTAYRESLTKDTKMSKHKTATIEPFTANPNPWFPYPRVCLPARPDKCTCAWSYCPSIGTQATPFVLKYRNASCFSRHTL